MKLRLLSWCVALGLVGAAAWPRDVADDPLNDSLIGLTVGALSGLLAGGCYELFAARQRSRKLVERKKPLV